MYVGLLAADTMSVSLHVINEKFGVRHIGLIIKVFQVDPIQILQIQINH